MIVPEGQKIPKEEEYANAFFYFHKSLLTLAEDAKDQCEALGYFNVAWEIRDDVLRGANAVLDLAGAELSKEQRDVIARLTTELAAVPDAVVNVGNHKEEHLHAMGDPCWVPLRALAKELIQILESETKRIRVFLGIDEDRCL